MWVFHLSVMLIDIAEPLTVMAPLQVLSKIHCFGSNEAMAEFKKDPMA
jgi:hypothetical protein